MSDAEPRSLEGTKDVPVGPRIQLSKNGPMTDMPGATPGAPARRKHHRKKDAESGTAKPLSPLRQDATGTVSEATASASDDAPSSSSACSSTDGTPLLVTVPDGVTPVAPDAKTPTLAQLPKDIAAVRSSTALPVSRTPDTASGAPLPKAQQSASMVDLGVAPKETPTNRMAVRVKDASVLSLFKLPATEIIIDSFSCAISRAYLQHGRAYLTQNYFCFHSKFCNEIKECVRLRDIVSVVKRNRFIVGIEIVTKNYERTLYSSFVNRNNVFTLLVTTWRTNIGAEDPAKRAPPGLGSPTMTPVMNTPPVLSPTDSALSEQAAKQQQQSNAAGALGSPRSSSISVESFINNEPLEHSPLHLDSIKQTETVRTVVNNVTPPQIFSIFYADGRPHFKRYHEAQEDKDIKEEPWVKRENGFSRTNRFMAPLKGLPIGPPETRCEELSWYSLSESTLVVDIIQTSLDIPYSDCFNVQTRWTYQLVNGHDTEISAVCGVYWLKKTWMKGTIESTTVSKCKAPHTNWSAYIASELTAHPVAESLSQVASTPTGEVAVQSQAAPSVVQHEPVANSTPSCAPSEPVVSVVPQGKDGLLSRFISHPVAKGEHGMDKSTVLIVLMVLLVLVLFDVAVQLRRINASLAALGGGHTQQQM